jgi:hypothetical protein
MRKHGLRAVGLALMAALGMMAFSATAAQASVLELDLYHLCYLLGGTVIPCEEGMEEKVTGEQESTEGILKIPAKNSEIRCLKGKVLGANIKNNADVAEGERKQAPLKLTAEGKGEIEFFECKVFEISTGKELAACTKVFNEKNKNGAGVAGHPVAKFDYLFLLHRHFSTIPGEELNTHYALWIALSEGENPFVTLEFGGTCALPEKAKVSGRVAAKILNPETMETKLKAEFDSESTEGKFYNGLPVVNGKLLFGANESFIKGKAFAELAGAQAGKTWGVKG